MGVDDLVLQDFNGLSYVSLDGEIDFHALRHTYGSMLAAAGVHPSVAQKLMRHSTITLTMDLYTHVYSGTDATAIDCLPSFEKQKPKKKQA